MTITESYDEFIFNVYKNRGITIPTKDSTIYIVRISHKNAIYDYNIMKQQQIKVWDKDSKNRIQVGDWLGFIVNDDYGEPLVELYYIERQMDSSKRPSHWKDDKYTDQKINGYNNRRSVIVFKNQPEIKYHWDDWKKAVAYSPNYMPRGNTKSKNPFNELTINIK